MKRLYWTGYCALPRNEAISRLEIDVNRHGYIVDFKPFSDVSMSLFLEVPENEAEALYRDLSDWMQLDDCDFSECTSQRDIVVLFNLSFAKSTGDLRHVVPDVPG